MNHGTFKAFRRFNKNDPRYLEAAAAAREAGKHLSPSPDRETRRAWNRLSHKERGKITQAFAPTRAAVRKTTRRNPKMTTGAVITRHPANVQYQESI